MLHVDYLSMKLVGKDFFFLARLSLHLEPAHPESLPNPEECVKPFKLIWQEDLIHQPPLGRLLNVCVGLEVGRGEVSSIARKPISISFN